MSKTLPTETYVYVIGNTDHPVVKIGYTTAPERRLAEIQPHSPLLLRFRWLATGTRQLERQLHQRFDDHHSHGEWYDFGDLDPIDEVERAAREFVDVLVLQPLPPPAPVRTAWWRRNVGSHRPAVRPATTTYWTSSYWQGGSLP